MKVPVAVLLLAASALALSPLAAASTVLPTTPASAGCALVDTDACTTAWAGSTYAFSLSGAFEGTATMRVSSATDPLDAYTISCTGTFIGAVTYGSCTQGGTYPSGPIIVECSSQGTGALACTIEGL